MLPTPCQVDFSLLHVSLTLSEVSRASLSNAPQMEGCVSDSYLSFISKVPYLSVVARRATLASSPQQESLRSNDQEQRVRFPPWGYVSINGPTPIPFANMLLTDLPASRTVSLALSCALFHPSFPLPFFFSFLFFFPAHWLLFHQSSLMVTPPCPGCTHTVARLQLTHWTFQGPVLEHPS